MRIAFISYEFPPETGGGGIATYLEQVVRALVRCGHDVEVFAGAQVDRIRDNEPEDPYQIYKYCGAKIHRIKLLSGQKFSKQVLKIFKVAHENAPFDVIEGNDFDASAVEVKRAYPHLPYVVKLHTPRFAIDELHYQPMSFAQKLRFSFGAIIGGKLPKLPVPIRETESAKDEIDSIQLADAIAAPSVAIKERALVWAAILKKDIFVFPYPYVPSDELLCISHNGQAQQRVLFIGRLEERKGVIDIVNAIPKIKSQIPQVKFRFVGKDIFYHKKGVSMKEYLTSRISKKYISDVEFTGPYSHDLIPMVLREADIVVFPSHWESFGLVCCEAMAAGCAVIGSKNGGMAEILGEGAYGVVVPPKSPDKIAKAVIHLFSNPDYRIMIGNAGRKRILDYYSIDSVLPQQLACYQMAIDKCRI